jgi:outer membrane receptor for ferrienterochelin and colicins
VFDRHALEESADVAVTTERWPGGAHVSRATVSGTLWRQQLLSDQRGSDVSDVWAESLDRRLTLALSHRFVAGRHFVVGGVDGTAEALDSDRVAGGHADRLRLALYAQDDWRVTDSPRVSVSPGARLDLDELFGWHATPHLAVRVDPVPTLTLRVSGGQGWRAPDFREMFHRLDHAGYGYVVEGNPALGPEASWGATGEARWAPVVAHAQGPRAPVSFSVGGWWNEVQDLVDVTLLEEGTAGSPARYTYGNVARAVTRGGEAGVTLAFGDRLSIEAGYTFTDARDRADDRPLDGRAPHRVAGSFSTTPLPWPLTLSTNAEWMGPRPYTDDADSTTWTSPTVLVDARLSLRVGKHLELEAGVRNALDARDEQTLGLAPRTFYAGLTARGP